MVIHNSMIGFNEAPVVRVAVMAILEGHHSTVPCKNSDGVKTGSRSTACL